MPTPEEEKERALKISKLYDHHEKIVITEEVKPKSFPASYIWKFSLLILLPIVTIYVLVTLFLGSQYVSISDVQGAGIAFVCAFILIGLVLYRLLGYYRQKIKAVLDNEVGLLWLTVLFLLPLILLIRKIFAFDSISGNLLLFLKLSLSSLLLLLVSSLYILLLAYVLERSNLNKRYWVAFFLAILPGIAYAIIS